MKYIVLVGGSLPSIDPRGQTHRHHEGVVSRGGRKIGGELVDRESRVDLRRWLSWRAINHSGSRRDSIPKKGPSTTKLICTL